MAFDKKRFCNFHEFIIDNRIILIYSIIIISVCFLLINNSYHYQKILTSIFLFFLFLVVTIIVLVINHSALPEDKKPNDCKCQEKIKKIKRGQQVTILILFMWIGLLIIPSVGLLRNGTPNELPILISLNEQNENKVLQVFNIKILSWPNYTSPSEGVQTTIEHNGSNIDVNRNIYKELVDCIYQLFVHYSWYITLIITILGVIAGVLMYYNWRSAQKIKAEWEEAFKKEAEINKAFQDIRYEVINDPRLRNGEDEGKLKTFARHFREGQITHALKYAFVAIEIQPEMRAKGKYTQQEVNDWDAALQYWFLAAYFLSDKDDYEKEHKEFIYGGLGNAYRYLANSGVEEVIALKRDKKIQNNDKIWVLIKGILMYYGKAFAAYEVALTSDPDNIIIINNRANLFMEIYRFKERLMNSQNGKQDNNHNNKYYNNEYERYWTEAVSISPILWKKTISLDGFLYLSTEGLLNEAHSSLSRLMEAVLSGSDHKRDEWFYRNYAIACFLKAKHDDPDKFELSQLFEEFKDNISKFIITHKSGKEKAQLELQEDEDLKNYSGLKNLLRELSDRK